MEEEALKEDKDHHVPEKAALKQKQQRRKICSSDSCTNIALNGGVCRRHGYGY